MLEEIKELLESNKLKRDLVDQADHRLLVEDVKQNPEL